MSQTTNSYYSAIPIDFYALSVLFKGYHRNSGFHGYFQVFQALK